jgi:hypothetical protein
MKRFNAEDAENAEEEIEKQLQVLKLKFEISNPGIPNF